MKAAGKKPILLGVSPEQHLRLKQASEREMRPLSQFIVYYALQAADEVLRSQTPLK